MMTYDMLSFLQKAVLRFGLLMLLCVSFYMLFTALKKRLPSLLVPTVLSVLISAGMLILYSADAWSRKYELDHIAAARLFCGKPILFTLFLLAVSVVLLTYAILREMHLRRTVPSPSSIKESIDHLPTGLCFYAENGRVMLVNHRMNRLCHILLGQDLQNAALMWDDLCKGNVQSDVERLSMESTPSYRLPDGTVWSFSRTELDGVFQLAAVDTTQLHGLAEELKQKNTALAALYERLKHYEENVEALTQERERLETKVGIHSELGQTLLATRSCLLGDNDKKTAPIEAWKRSIALLRQRAVPQTEGFDLQTLVGTAAAFGVCVEAVGQMPEPKEIEKLFLEAATEALTNAVRHAEARCLHICFSENATDYAVCFRNDGKPPQAEITEGGGLGSLRRKIETSGGSVCILCQPEYSLTVTIPKGGNERI